jgi:uncharacterized membrane protein YgcG
MTDQEKLLQDAVQNRALAAAQNTVKPTYAGTFEGQLNDIFDKIQNREPFSYNVNEDPLYQSYKDQYIQGGKLAMKDTMGQAAALTGGYGNTYGQQVGQQAYNAYLQNLSAVIPELYDRAYGKYQDEGDDLKDQYAMVGQMRDTEYGRYRDDVGDWEYDQKVAAEREQEDYNRRTAEEQRAWQQQQQAYANLVALIKASGATPTDDQLAAAGMTRADADALRDEFNRQVAAEQAAAALAAREAEARISNYYSSGSGGGGRSSGGSGGGGGGSGGGSYSGGGSWSSGGSSWSSEGSDYLDYPSAYDVAKTAASSGYNYQGINNLASSAGLSSRETRNLQEAYQAVTQAGVNRSAAGSPTATKAQNMGGNGYQTTYSGTVNYPKHSSSSSSSRSGNATSLLSAAVNKIKNLFK